MELHRVFRAVDLYISYGLPILSSFPVTYACYQHSNSEAVSDLKTISAAVICHLFCGKSRKQIDEQFLMSVFFLCQPAVVFGNVFGNLKSATSLPIYCLPVSFGTIAGLRCWLALIRQNEKKFRSYSCCF